MFLVVLFPLILKHLTDSTFLPDGVRYKTLEVCKSPKDLKKRDDLERTDPGDVPNTLICFESIFKYLSSSVKSGIKTRVTTLYRYSDCSIMYAERKQWWVDDEADDIINREKSGGYGMSTNDISQISGSSELDIDLPPAHP